MDARYTREQWVKEFNSILGEERKPRSSMGPPAVVDTSYHDDSLHERDQISLAFMSTTGSVVSGGIDMEEEMLRRAGEGDVDDSAESIRIALERLRDDTARGLSCEPQPFRRSRMKREICRRSLLSMALSRILFLLSRNPSSGFWTRVFTRRWVTWSSE